MTLPKAMAQVISVVTQQFKDHVHISIAAENREDGVNCSSVWQTLYIIICGGNARNWHLVA